MPTTTNFGWTTPADTDLVKNGALAIRTLGNGIDTTMLDLKGGTTGQVLSKASNTDMDFTWVAQDDSNAIQNALLTTTGDTIYASSASTPARLGIGSTGQVLTVSGGVPTWATPSSGGMTLLSTTALTGASVTVSSISTSYNDLKFVFEDVYSATDGVFMYIQLNGDTGSKYSYQYYNTQDAGTRQANSAAQIEVSKIRNSSSLTTDGYMLLSNYNNTTSVAGTMSFTYSSLHTQGGSFGYNNAAAITSVKVYMSSGNISGGSLKIYGVK